MADDCYWHFLGLKPGASAAEITAAHRRLAKMFHPDRGGTTADMQRLQEAFEIVTGKREAPSSGIFGSSSSSGSLADLARILQLELTIRGLQDQLERERKDAEKRSLQHWKVADSIIDARNADIKRFEDLARQLATVVLGLKSLKPAARAMLERGAKFRPEWNFEIDELIEMSRWVIDGPVKEAVSKSNSKGSLQAELDRMKADQRQERQRLANLPEIKCAAPGCANTFRPNRRGHKTCSDACRKALSRTQVAIQ